MIFLSKGQIEPWWATVNLLATGMHPLSEVWATDKYSEKVFILL